MSATRRCIRMCVRSGRAGAGLALLGFASLALACSGCSLIDPGSRPVMGQPRNLNCRVEYRPGPAGADDGFDLLLTATAQPYRTEEFYMSLPDVLFHGIFAPGRYLTRDAEVQGATCTAPRSGGWSQGDRLPSRFRPRSGLRCVRHSDERVAFIVETKYARCEVEIPEGDRAPRCHPYRDYDGSMFRMGVVVEELLGDTACEADSRPAAQGQVSAPSDL